MYTASRGLSTTADAPVYSVTVLVRVIFSSFRYL